MFILFAGAGWLAGDVYVFFAGGGEVHVSFAARPAGRPDAAKTLFWPTFLGSRKSKCACSTTF